MASRNLGTLTVDLIAKIGGFTKGMTEAERAADKSSREMKKKMAARAEEVGKAWQSISNVLASAVAGITVGAVFQKFIIETVNAQNEQALLAAALKATGNSAGYSQDRLNDMAGALEDITAFSAGEFNQAQTVLLGFTNIVGEQLPKALQAAADFATRTGVSMASAAETMGRALDVPSSGMVSLQRQGFKFTESQIEAAKALEETGRVAEAQQVVFDALEETYGGAAAAARDTLGGEFKALQNTINSLLTGEGGSIQELQAALKTMRATLADEQTRTAFSTLMTWMAQLATSVIQLTANLVTFIQTKDKLGALTGTDEFGKMKDRAKDAAYELTRLTSEYARMREQQASDPNNAKLNARVKAWEDRIKSARREVDEASNSLKTFSQGFKSPEVAAVVAPDLAPRTVGPVKLKNETKKTGKSQTEKDEDAAKRFLETLKEQVFKTQDKTAYEKLFFDIQNKGLKLSEKQLGQATGLATAIDMAKEAEQRRAVEIDRQNTLYQLQERLMGTLQQYENELSTYGMGDQAAQEMQGRIALQQKQQQELRQMQHEHGQELRAAETEAERERLQAMFGERYTLTQQALAQELQMYDDYLQQKRQKEGDWQSGALAGIRSFAEQSENAYQQMKQVTENVMGGMSAQLTDLVMTGKADFTSLARTVISQLINMAIQAAVTQAAMSFLSFVTGGAGGSIFKIFGFSDGGYTGPGGKYTPAGIVHAGEGVLSQKDMAAMGGPRAFEAFRRSLHSGYADGGYVGTVPAAQPGYAASRYDTTSRAGTTVQVVEDAGRAGQVEQSTDERGQEIINVFVANVRRGGEAAKAIETTYGLGRRGR